MSFFFIIIIFKEINLYYQLWQYQTPTVVRDGSSSRPKGSRFERAIKDLEKIVAECKSNNFWLSWYNMFLVCRMPCHLLEQDACILICQYSILEYGKNIKCWKMFHCNFIHFNDLNRQCFFSDILAVTPFGPKICYLIILLIREQFILMKWWCLWTN